jgi:hypothetical protein
MEEEAPRAPPTQFRATIQRHHPIDQILGDISKGVTTRSRLANFCEHYSFVSSIEPFRVEDVAELPELFQLKCPSPALEARPHLNGNNPSIPRI